MALTAGEVMSGGFVIVKATGALSITFITANSVISGGFLRDQDGRLVVSLGA